MTPRLTVGVTTRDRADSLNRCLGSLDVLRALSPEILVFDDGSNPPAQQAIAMTTRVRVLRDDPPPGYIVGRNRLVREAAAPAVLLLDDDTRILSRESIEQALAVMSADPRVAVVAFPQAEADGRPWPAGMQPSTATVPSIIASFIGFAHLVRRDVFLAIAATARTSSTREKRRISAFVCSRLVIEPFTCQTRWSRMWRTPPGVTSHGISGFSCATTA